MNYILQKDLPDLKAGTIFIPTEDGEGYFYNILGVCYKYSTVFHCTSVENNPEWFKPEPPGFNYFSPILCPPCDGTGIIQEGEQKIKCSWCQGTGRISYPGNIWWWDALKRMEVKEYEKKTEADNAPQVNYTDDLRIR